VIYTLQQKNNQYYELDQLVDATTLANMPPSYINNATGTVKILDQSANAMILDGVSATSIPLNYVASSNGVYRALIISLLIASSNSLAPVGTGYTIVIDLTTPSGAIYHRELLAEVVIARGN
jgi:hypothetical protein